MGSEEVIAPKVLWKVKLNQFFSTFWVWLKRIIIWLIFTVGSALTAILVSWVVLTAANKPFDLGKLLSHGELIAISIALTGEGMGFWLSSRKRNYRILKNVMGYVGLMVLIGSILVLGVITDRSYANLPYSVDFVVFISFVAFATSILVGSVWKGLES